jgi:hypothetical protein
MRNPAFPQAKTWASDPGFLTPREKRDEKLFAVYPA